MHDINIPLSSSSSKRSKSQEASICQTRLSQLGGFQGIAFTHTVYGRIKLDKDDADYTLPWRDLLPSSSDDRGDNKKMISSTTSNAYDSAHHRVYGRTNTQGMKIYRRLNIILEDVSDVSRLLLLNNSEQASYTRSTSDLLQKYDIISLQPMNELALQNICELLMNSSTAKCSTATQQNNNTRYIDIIVLEYATGSRGGKGLPYKLRKDYLIKILQAGITFEVCYGTAILDPKRRQGFVRTILDFQSTYNSIQKKYMLMTSNQHQQQASLKDGTKICKFPLLISSGPRQNYTAGTNDEGVLAFRTLYDVECFVGTLLGGGNNGNKQKKKKGMVQSADRVLSRARNRAMGVVHLLSGSTGGTKRVRQREWDSKTCVVGMTNQSTDDKSSDDDDEETEEAGASRSLVDWLSEPLRKKTREDNDTGSVQNLPMDSLPNINKSINNQISCKDKGREPEVDKNDDEDDNNVDIKDGFISL